MRKRDKTGLVLALLVLAICSQLYRLKPVNLQYQASADAHTILIHMEEEAKLILNEFLKGEPVPFEKIEALNTGVPLQRFCSVVIAEAAGGTDIGFQQYKRVVDAIERHKKTEAGQHFVLNSFEEKFFKLLSKLYKKEADPKHYKHVILDRDASEITLSVELGFIGKLLEFRMGDLYLNRLIGPIKMASAVHLGYRTAFFLLIIAVVILALVTAYYSQYRTVEKTIRRQPETIRHVGRTYLTVFCWCMAVFFLSKFLINDQIGYRLVFLAGGGLVLLVFRNELNHSGQSIWTEIGYQKSLDHGHVPRSYCAFVVVSVLVGYGSYWFYPEIVSALRGGEMDFSPVMTRHHPTDNILAIAPIEMIIGVFILVAIYAPFAEETLDRGFLFQGLCKLLYARVSHQMALILATLITGVIFSILHPQDWIVWGAIYAASTVMCFLTVKYRSLWPAIGYHATVNMVSFLYGMFMYS